MQAEWSKGGRIYTHADLEETKDHEEGARPRRWGGLVKRRL